MGRDVLQILVVGEDARRADVVARLDRSPAFEVSDGDPDLGDLVMYIRLEGIRFGAVLFLGHANPVTRGALAAVAEKAILAPLVGGSSEIDPRFDGYLYRLPRVLAFRDEEERQLVLGAIPKSAGTPSAVVGKRIDDLAALGRAFEQATHGTWHWAAFVGQVEAEVATATVQS